MEVLKEVPGEQPEELYGVAVAIRPEVMNGEMADFLLPLDGRCINILPVHLQTPEAGAGGGGNVRDVRRRAWRSAESLLTPEVYVRCAAPAGVADDDPVGGTLAEVYLMAKTLYPDWVKNPSGVRAGERA